MIRCVTVCHNDSMLHWSMEEVSGLTRSALGYMSRDMSDVYCDERRGKMLWEH